MPYPPGLTASQLYKSRESGLSGAVPVNFVIPLTIRVIVPGMLKPLGPRSTSSLVASEV
jgi:hypothetical protein